MQERNIIKTLTIVVLLLTLSLTAQGQGPKGSYAYQLWRAQHVRDSLKALSARDTNAAVNPVDTMSLYARPSAGTSSNASFISSSTTSSPTLFSSTPSIHELKVTIPKPAPLRTGGYTPSADNYERHPGKTPIRGTALAYDDESEAVPTGHLSYQGVPITGHVSDFLHRMQDKGYGILIDMVRDMNNILFKGSGSNAEQVEYFSDSNFDNVRSIKVFSSEKRNWRELNEEYTRRKRELTATYGAPVETVEKFAKLSGNNDNARYMATKFGKCLYRTRYECAAGTIVLSVECDDELKCKVCTTMVDAGR